MEITTMSAQPDALTAERYMDLAFGPDLAPNGESESSRFLDDLRRSAPVFRTPLGHWSVTTHQDINELLRDTETWSSNPSRYASDPDPYLSDPVGGPFSKWYAEILMFKDGADHRRLRRLVSRMFTRRAIEDSRPIVRAAVKQQLAEAIDGRESGEMDFVRDFTLPLPTRVILDLFGLPLSEEDRFHDLTNLIIPPMERGTPEEWFAHADAVYGRHVEFFEELAAERRADPRDDLVTAIVCAEEDGSHLSDLEVMAMIAFIVTAGYETTAYTLANGLYVLLSGQGLPDADGDPGVIGSCAEEMLRYAAAPRTTAPRIATRDTELHGVPISEGDMVICSLQAANRDPEVFDDPHRFDPNRSPNPHLAFGVGPHVCLGAPLARIELQESLAAIIESLPTLELAGEPTWKASWLIRAADTLPVRW
jgi:cytochrome P450